MYDLPHENLTYHKIGSARGFLVLGGIMAGQGRRVPLTTRPNWPNGCPLSPVPRRDGGLRGRQRAQHDDLVAERHGLLRPHTSLPVRFNVTGIDEIRITNSYFPRGWKDFKLTNS